MKLPNHVERNKFDPVKPGDVVTVLHTPLIYPMCELMAIAFHTFTGTLVVLGNMSGLYQGLNNWSYRYIYIGLGWVGLG